MNAQQELSTLKGWLQFQGSDAALLTLKHIQRLEAIEAAARAVCADAARGFNTDVALDRLCEAVGEG